jgi:hypothetical protein
MGKISIAEVPSATLGTGSSTPRNRAVSRDKSVTRFAQDDDFVGVLTKSIPNKLALMGLRPGLISVVGISQSCARRSALSA